jgi:nickel-dependent lactate racemase
VIPGLSSINTIKEYRKIYFDSGVAPGIIELNPIKEDVLDAINKTQIDYALNFVTNNEGKIIAIHGGGYEESWGKAINSLIDLPDVSTEGSADIVIISAGGAPFDQNLYQASWALINASKAVKKNGTIVLLAECVTGLGADAFTKLARVVESSELKRRYMYGAEALDLMKQVLKNNKIILVSALPTYLVESIGLDVARTANDAYKMAMQSRRGRKTVVIPYGCKTIWNKL